MTRVLLILSVAIVLGETARIWWLHPAARHWEDTSVPRLDVGSLERDEGLKSVPVEGNVDTGALRFDEAAYLQGKHEESGPLAVLSFTYRPNNRSLWSDLFTHPPEICMRSSGCAREATMPARMLTLGNQTIPVRILKYRDPTNSMPLFILKAVWLPPGSPIQPGSEVADRRALWVSMALHRIPHPPGAVLLTGIWGVEQEEVAWHLFQRHVARHFHLPRVP